MTPQESLLVLNAIPGLSGEALRKLIAAFGSANQVLEQKENDLLDLGLNPTLVTNIVHFPKDRFLEAEYNYLRNLGAEIMTLEDDDYPSLLKEIKHAPFVLYLKGNRQLLNSTSIALVGARKATTYGLKIAEEFGSCFAQAQITVVSGLAYGIDTASHRGALKAKGATIAVLGCGLNHVYPKENTGLFNEIAKDGLLVSEFPLNTPPLTYNFPRRNRIVSGLSLATIVVEAKERSGALITADFALEQSREVFAVPGDIDNESSKGTNRLIKEGAKIALSVHEVIEELGFEIQNQIQQENKTSSAQIHLSEDEYKIYELLNHEPQHIDIISSHSKADVGALMGQMLNLEIKGAIKQLPGQYYVRL
jgi:DNA processing protein